MSKTDRSRKRDTCLNCGKKLRRRQVIYCSAACKARHYWDVDSAKKEGWSVENGEDS